MTGSAADTPPYVHTMIEVDEVGQPVHTLPGDRLPREITAADDLQQRAGIPDLSVATHAHVSRRHTGERASLGAGMAVDAIDLIVDHVVAMVELYGLLGGRELSCIPRTSDVKTQQDWETCRRRG